MKEMDTQHSSGLGLQISPQQETPSGNGRLSKQGGQCQL